MAHGHERGVVRRARHAARRGARLVPSALVVLTLAAGAARAQAPLDAFELSGGPWSDVASWMGEPGNPATADLVWFGTAFPHSYAGLALGGWRSTLEGRVTTAPPWTGSRMGPSLAALDTLHVELGAGGATEGYEGALANALAERPARSEPVTRSTIRLGGGDYVYNDHMLAIERGDSLRWLRVESLERTQFGVGSLNLGGEHLWQVSGQWARRGDRISGGYGIQGNALALIGGPEQSAAGAGGYLRYRHVAGAWTYGLGWERAYDHQESFGDNIALFGGIDGFSRRESQSNRGNAWLSWVGSSLDLGASFMAANGAVLRRSDTKGETANFRDQSRWVWGTGSAGFRAGPGRAQLQLGIGSHEAFGGLDTAPSVDYRVAGGRWFARAGFERVLWAGWSDVAVGETPFLQSTWAGVVEGRAGDSAHELHATVLGGRTSDRAIVIRAPIEDLWLRGGLVADLDAYDFALTNADAAWRGRHWGLRGEGFGLWRHAGPTAPATDPAWGGRLQVEYRTALFKNDLGLWVRPGVEAVGQRVADEGYTIPAYATSTFDAVATILDAVLTMRIRNLEDRVRPQSWLDPSTLDPALGAGREMRFFITLRLSN